jgi:chromosome partitioning protein
MYVVSIVNQKGGVAKTTTAANLGACLAAKGLRTLLIDLDPQANLTLGLRAEASSRSHGLHDVLLSPETYPLREVIRQIGDAPLYMAPGHMEMSRCEAMLMPLGGSAYRLSRAIEGLGTPPPYDWILIDCPPSLGTLTQNAIVASTHLLIPTEPKFYSFAGIDTLNKMIVGLTRDLRFEVRLLGVLLTLCDRGTNLSRTITAEIRERFGDRVFETVIYKNVRLAEAEVEGEPIVQFDKRSKGAQNYAALADEVLRRICS